MVRFFLRICYNIIIWLAVGLFLGSPVYALTSDNEVSRGGYLLVLNSYTSDAAWSNVIISPLQEQMAMMSDMGLYVEHMNMLTIDDSIKFDQFKTDFFHRYSRAPKAIVLLGNTALMMCDEFKRHWGKDIPFILCGEQGFQGPSDAYIKKRAVPVADQIPLERLRQDYNLTLLKTQYFLSENINLMKKMIPGMKKLFFIGDARFVNQQCDYDLRALLSKSYPNLEYEFLSAATITTDSLLRRLNQTDPAVDGLLFSSWFTRKAFAGSDLLMAGSFQIISNTKNPIFSLSNAVMENSQMVGGYFYEKQPFDVQLKRTLKAVLAGTAPRNIPFYTPPGYPVFDYPMLLQKGLNPVLCPDNTVFLNRPESFWEQYKYPIIGVGILIAVLLLTLYQSIRIKSLKTLRSAQQKEIEANAELSNLFDNMPILYAKISLIRDELGEISDAEICRTNNRFINTFNPSEATSIKKMSDYPEEDYVMFKRFLQFMDSEKRPINFTYYLKQSDTYINIILAFSVQTDHVDIFGVDTTELHRAQMKLDSINHKLVMALDVANIIPWKWNLLEHTILCDVNRPIELSTEQQDFTEEQLSVPESQYFSKIHKEDRQRVEQAYRDLIEGKCVKVKEEYRVVGHSGHAFQMDWVEAQAAVEKRDENGRPLTLVGSSLVITQRKEMEQNLLHAKNKAEESNRLKSAFLANMSHEIRTPLNAIVGFSGLLSTVSEEEEQQEYVNIIENNNTLLLQLIGDILDLSKIEAGTVDFIYSDFDLNQLMQELESSLRLKLQNENVALCFKPGTSFECFVHAEKNRISQLIINLVNNAIKFTNEGHIHFGYEIRGSLLYFFVQDTGIGIPNDKVGEIFERFVKLNSFAQGTGLGLSICQTLVEHMGGEIGVESDENKGSTFWFTLPYKQGKKVQVDPKQKQVKSRVKKLRILIAEDNDSNYKLFQSTLKDEYCLFHAWNGKEAVDMFQSEAPDIVLMDLNMPIMDGYEATREIRKIDPLAPIIAITAFAYASDEQRVMDNGFDAYMTKPIRAGKLKEKLTEIIQARLILL